MASDEHKKAVRALRNKEKTAERRRIKAAQTTARLDADGIMRLDMCAYCGATNALRHKRRTNACVDCGGIYERWHKAVRNGVQSELALLKPIILQRYKTALRVDKPTAERVQKFIEGVYLTEVVDMQITEKKCKQCGRLLSIDSFRAYKPRGRGVYNTKQGHNTICKECESVNNRVITATKSGDTATLELLRQHYQTLMDCGLPPVTAAAKRLLGVQEDTSGCDSLENLLQSMQRAAQGLPDAEVEEHCRLVRERGYASFEEADAAYKRLAPRLREAGVYAEITDLMDEWFEEG